MLHDSNQGQQQHQEKERETARERLVCELACVCVRITASSQLRRNEGGVRSRVEAALVQAAAANSNDNNDSKRTASHPTIGPSDQARAPNKTLHSHPKVAFVAWMVAGRAHLTLTL